MALLEAPDTSYHPSHLAEVEKPKTERSGRYKKRCIALGILATAVSQVQILDAQLLNYNEEKAGTRYAQFIGDDEQKNYEAAFYHSNHEWILLQGLGSDLTEDIAHRLYEEFIDTGTILLAHQDQKHSNPALMAHELSSRYEKQGFTADNPKYVSFFGHSTGGVLAHTIAEELEKTNHVIPKIIIADSSPSSIEAVKHPIGNHALKAQAILCPYRKLCGPIIGPSIKYVAHQVANIKKHPIPAHYHNYSPTFVGRQLVTINSFGSHTTGPQHTRVYHMHTNNPRDDSVVDIQRTHKEWPRKLPDGAFYTVPLQETGHAQSTHYREQEQYLDGMQYIIGHSWLPRVEKIKSKTNTIPIHDGRSMHTGS